MASLPPVILDLFRSFYYRRARLKRWLLRSGLGLGCGTHVCICSRGWCARTALKSFLVAVELFSPSPLSAFSLVQVKAL